MRLIKPSVILLDQAPGLEGMYKQIELAGRICYESYDKITEDSAKAFVERMIKSGHGAMLEHGTVYLRVPENDINYHYYLSKYEKNPYSRCNYGLTFNGSPVGDICITSNYRVLVQNNWLDDLRYICEPTEYHEKRITVKWITDRVTGESFLRHRVFSFARESTRHCNYGKSRFNNEVKFIIPTWVDIKEGRISFWNNDWCDMDNLSIVKNYNKDRVDMWLESCNLSELYYKILINKGCKAQEARQVLSFSVCSPLVMTGFVSDWKHFFDLRCDKAAHPDAQYLANKCLELFKEHKYL